MSDTTQTEDEARSGQSAGHASDYQAVPFRRKRKRRPLRVALITLGSLLCLVIVAVAGSYAYVNHVVSSIPRLRVAGLVAPVSPGSLDGQTFLFTSDPQGPTGTSVAQKAQSAGSNLIMLFHTNANGKSGGAVALPGKIMVNVPGHGTELLWDTFSQGSASLLVQTITKLTGVSISHYARVDFNHISDLINAMGGVNVTVPTATKGFGYTFVKGVNHLTGVAAVYYSRDPTLSDQDRLLRQENLTRASMTQIADNGLLTNPVTAVHVLSAITSMLAVDSNFTNSDIESLVTQFGSLAADAATFVTAPTLTVGTNVTPNAALDAQLWTAIKHDSLVAFAKKYPSSVTPVAAP